MFFMATITIIKLLERNDIIVFLRGFLLLHTPSWGHFQSYFTCQTWWTTYDKKRSLPLILSAIMCLGKMKWAPSPNHWTTVGRGKNNGGPQSCQRIMGKTPKHQPVTTSRRGSLANNLWAKKGVTNKNTTFETIKCNKSRILESHISFYHILYVLQLNRLTLSHFPGTQSANPGAWDLGLELAQLGDNPRKFLRTTARLCFAVVSGVHLRWFPEIGQPLDIIPFTRIFHYKPYIFGYPPKRETIWVCGFWMVLGRTKKDIRLSKASMGWVYFKGGSGQLFTCKRLLVPKVLLYYLSMFFGVWVRILHPLKHATNAA